jgi:uncharacterized protein involved in exopolysaccharide biosynthesis/Mrp family chromosome partitioning ATPase
MNPKQTTPPPHAGISLDEIYYILFRRKWVILVFSLLGFAAAGAALALKHPPYRSVAELYVRYITEAQLPDFSGIETHTVPPDHGALILNSEIKILLSFDLAKQVAETVGPPKILGDSAAGTNMIAVNKAAAMIEKNLQAEVSKQTQIISISFAHPDPGVAQQVLDLLIANYLVRQNDIHQKAGQFNEILKQMAGGTQTDLANTEAELARVKSQGNIVDIGEALKSYTTIETSIQQERNAVMADLDGAAASANVLSNLLNKTGSANAGQPASSNAIAGRPAPPAAAELQAYAEARQHQADLQAAETSLESKYTTNHVLVKTNLIELAAAKAKVKALEDQTPGLLTSAAATSGAMSDFRSSAASSALDPAAAYNAEVANIAKLQAKLKAYDKELATLQDRGTNLNLIEAKINEFERNRKMQQDELMRMAKTTDNLTIAAENGPNSVANISVSQQPTPPVRDTTKTYKLVAGIAGGGVALGLSLAFLLEMVLDRSFKRPHEVASRLGLPFFLTVPSLNGHRPLRLSEGGGPVKLLPPGSDTAKDAVTPDQPPAPAPAAPNASWDEKHALRPFHETLRDRLIAYFDMANLTHKPKLVALTSCHTGAGVSTLASGLASALSETGDGNVLLVDMNSENGQSHRFYKGRLNLGLDDIFDKEKPDRQDALVQDNLYVVKESSNHDKLPAFLPKRFGHLVSKMKASDYDYIIFDMPPVTQISVTPRLARFMDMVLLVIESGKTDRDVAQRAAALLSESRANVGVVMNKNRSYVPKRLHQEF